MRIRIIKPDGTASEYEGPTLLDCLKFMVDDMDLIMVEIDENGEELDT